MADRLMTIVLNGESRRIDAGVSLSRLLDGLELPVSRVAVERNREVVPRGRFDSVILQDGDRLEIVTFVGGG